MKTLRRFRTSLGAFMTALVAIWQICSPMNLQAATFYWDDDLTAAGNNAGTGAGLGNGPNTNTWIDGGGLNNWWDGLNPDTTWSNAGNHTAVFTGTAGEVYLGGNITAGGLTFNVDGYEILPTAGFPTYEKLTFAGGTPTVTLASGVGATIATTIGGTSGLTINGAGAASTLTLAPPNDEANTLTGGININNARLATNVTSSIKPLGTNAITLGTGAILDITPMATTANGLSERAFGGINATLVASNTSRIDFTSTANKTLLFNSAPLVPVDVSTRVISNGLNYGDLKTSYLPQTLVDATNGLNNTAYQWVGQLRITTPGSYQFGTASDDGSRLFVDGVLVVNNDGGKGVTDSSNFITLSAGLHDIRIDNVNGTGGTGEIFRYGGAGLDQAYGTVLNTAVLFQAEVNTAAGSSTAIQMLNALNVTGSSTINLNGGDFTQVQFGNFSINTGNTLTVGGLAGKTMRVGAATLGNAAGFITFDSAPNIAFDGAVTDGGNAMVINKLGVGRLIFDQTAVANSLSASTVINMQAGELVLVGSPVGGTFNPIGNAQITLNGGNLVLDSKGGNGATGPTYDNTVNVNVNSTIQSINNAATTILGSSTKSLNIDSGRTLTLDAIAGSSTTANNPAATLQLAGNLTGDSTTVISAISSVLGTGAITPLRGGIILSGNNSGFSGTFNLANAMSLAVQGNTALVGSTVNISGGSSTSFLFDGNGNVNSESVAFNDDLNITGTGTVTMTVGRLGTTYAPIFTQALNKTAQFDALTMGAQTLSVANNNGYGVDFTGATTLSGASNFTVGTGTNSNVVQGLTLSGQVTGGATGAGVVTFTKAGAGTLVLGNNATGLGANSFGGSGSIIDITLGALSVGSREALGNVGFIRLNASAASGSIFRVTDDMTLGTTDPRLQFGNATAANLKIVQVTEGKTLNLDNVLDFSLFTDNLEFQDLGTTYFGANANNTTYGGRILLRNGVISVDNLTHANAFGIAGVGNTSGDLVVSGTAASTNASLNLSGGATVSEVITLGTQSGFNQTGAIRSVSGTNTISSQIFNGAAPFIGADTGSILNITGGFAGGGTSLTLTGGGTINFTTTALNAAAAPITLGRPTASNSGTVNIGVASSLYVGALTVNRGTLNVGVAGVGSVGGTGAIIVAGNGTLAVNDATIAAPNRMGGNRTMQLVGGNFIYTANGGAVSTEAFGALTSSHGANTITLNNGGVSNATLTFASLAGNAVSGGSVLTFSSVQTFNTTTNNLVFTTAPTLTSGIIQRAIVKDAAGLNFATLNGNSIVAYTAYNNSGAYSDINTAAAADNVKVGAGLVTTDDLTAGKTINSLYISGNSLSVDGSGVASNTLLTITSGNILVNGGSNSLGTGLIVAFGGTEGGISVDTGSSLAVNGPITNSNNVTKGLGGDLTFNTKQYFNTAANYFTVLGGTVTLNGGVNTLYQGAQGGTAGQHLAVGFGATLDLNGNSQMVGDLRTPNGNAAVGGGGTVTSATAATFITANSASTWGGQITGNIFYNKTGGNALTFNNDNTYTGGTLINGNTLTVTDAGRLSGTTSIALRGGTLAIRNDGTIELDDRVNDAAAITLSGFGVLTLTGRDATNVSETVGDIYITQGGGNIQSNNTANTTAPVRSTVLALGNMYQSDGAMLLLNGPTGQMGNASRLTALNGTSLMTNGIVSWMNFGGADLVSYVAPPLDNASGGFAALGTAGYRGYDGTVLPASSNAAGNYKVATAISTLGAGGLDLNALVLSSGVAQTLTFASNTDVMNLTAGIMIKTGNFNVNVGSTVDNGRLTAGGAVDSALVDLNFVVTAAAANPLILNSRIVDNGTEKVRLTFTGYNTGVLQITNGQNSYTGGTTINTTNGVTNGTFDLNVAGADGTSGNSAVNLAATLADSLVINGGNVRLLGSNQIHFGITPILRGTGATLNLNGFNQTLAGLSFDNNGGSTAPTVTIGAGTLTLNGDVSAISSNAGSVSSITSSGAGVLALNGAMRTFNVAPVTINGSTTVANLTPTLTVSAAISGNASSGILKTGNGILQLSSTASTFGGGVNLSTGGLMIGASSTASARPFFDIAPVVTSGPLGTGTFTIGGGTRILSSASANTIGNQIVIGGNFEFDGLNNLTMNGDVSLGNAMRTISVNTPQMTATFGGVVSGTGTAGIIKDGYGTLVLSNVNTFTGGITLNNGTLVGSQPAGANASGNPFGSGAITYNGGTLSMRSTFDAIFGNDINVNSSLQYVNLDVQGTSGPNTIRMGDLNLPTSSLNPTVSQVNVTGGTVANPSTLVVTTNSLGLNNGSTTGSRVVGEYQTFNIAANTTLAITSGGFERNNEALNIGPGTLLLGGSNNFTDNTTITTSNAGAAPTVGAVNAVYGTGAVTLSNGVTYTIAPQLGAIPVGALAGATTGGLQQTFTNVSASGSLANGGNWGLAPGSVFNGVQPNDVGLDRVLYTNANNGLVVYNGYLNITTGGTYSFIVGSDDNSSLVIDGVEVARDNPGGHGVQDTARGSITLAAGQHTITMKVNAGGGQPGGGSRLLYSGPDTAANGGNNGYMAVPSTALSYYSGPASALNNYYNAAQIDNDYNVAAAATATLQGLGTDFNSTLKSLTLGNGSTLGVTNDLGVIGVGGTGFMGIIGTTTVGTGVTLNPTTGNLYLIGGISDGGNGLTKTGAGTLSLNNSTAFTGAFAINAGTVRIFEANALSTGGNTVASGASLDLNGTTSSSGRNVTINGAGTVSQFGALYNSSAATASLAGTLTLATASTIAGYGDILISGDITSSTLLTKNGPNTLTLTGNNSTMTGGLTITSGVVNNGTLNSGATTALGGGAGIITVNTNSLLNLSGNGTDRSITTNGTSISNRGPNQNSLGNIINSSISSSFATAAAPAPGSAFMKQANTANTATISGNITMNTGTLGIGSNTFASGGDIIVTGAFSGTQTITKVGGNNLFLRGTNTFAGGPTIHAGTLTLDGAGVFNGTGGSITVNEGGSFVLDNGTTFTNNRINNNVVGNNRRLVLAGGTLTITGNATNTNDVTELFSASVAGGNNSGIRLDQGHNNINLTPVSTGGSLTVTVTRNGTNIDFEGTNGATALITARNLGQAVAGTDGNANIILTNGLATTNGLHFIGQNSNTNSGGANGILNKGISSFIIVDDGTNINFATYDSVANFGIRGLDTGAGTAEYGVSNTNALQANNNILITANTNTTANTAHSLNSLKLTGGTLTLSQGSNINLNSGGILATADATITGPGIFSVDGTPVASGTSGSQNLYIHTIGVGTDLTFDSSIGYTNNNSGRLGELVKAGTGNLILGGANFHTTNTRVQEGTLTLNNDQAIFYRQTLPATTSNFNSSNAGPTLQINQGATLNMNNRDLTVNNFNSINPGGGQGSLSGGTVINSVGGTKNFTMNATTNNTWSGNISSGTGAINFARYGRDTFTITNENTYTGTTIIGGGATTMVDVGALRGTSGVTINAATLIWNDNGTQGDAYRLGAAPADVTFNGGGFQYNGRQGAFSVANLGDVVLASGANQITANASNYGNATVQMASFTRNAGAVINFAGSVLGDDGNVKVTGGVTNYNGIVGGWAISTVANPYFPTGAGSFVEYDAATGFRAIVDFQTTGVIDYTSGTDRPAFGNAAFGVNKNVRVNSNTTLAAGNNVANSMVIGINATTTLTFAAPADTLFIQSGGILGTTDNNGKVIGASVAGGGKITAGNSDGTAGLGNPNYDLYLHNLGNTMTVNAQIVDNGANAVNLVTSTGSVSGPAIRLSNTNTYTGSTIVNSTDLRLGSTVGTTLANSTSISIVGGNSGAADSSPQAMSRIFFENAGNQLNSGATVNIINNATLDTNNFNQTIANIVFNNTGGHTGTNNGVGGSVRSGTGTITLTGSITATNLTNISTIPFILGNLDLNGGQRTVTVDAITGAGAQGAAQVGLSILANMSNGGINKEGTGVLAITGVNSYTGATNINNGTLVLAGRDQQTTPAAITASLQGSRVNVASTATVDMRGGNAFIGSLGGAGTVTNSVYGTHVAGTGVPATLTIGADNTSTANFSGRFTNFINGINETTGYALNITKIGTGIQTISGDNASSFSPAGSNGDMNNVGTFDIQEGTILVNGANGSLGFTAINLKAGATLILDNSVDNKANRLGGYRLSDSANGDTANDTGTGRTISMQGGTLVFKEGSTLVNEGTLSALSMASNQGMGSVTLTSGSSTWLFDDSVGSGGVTINVNSMTAGAGSLHLNAGVSQSLGQAAAGSGSVNVYVNGVTIGGTAQGSGTLGVIGAALVGATGVQGNVVGGIRSDITATDSTGTGFVTYDRFGYRLLVNDEYSTFPGQPDTPLETGGAATPSNPPDNWIAVNPNITATYTGNARVDSALVWTTNTTILSLRLDNGGGLTSAGGAIPAVNSPTQLFNPLGLLNTLTISSGSIVANTGNTGLTGGAVSAGGGTLRITAAGDITSSSYLVTTQVGTAFVKDGAGTLNQTRKVYLGSSTDQGSTFVNNGILQLNAGPNTLAALNTANVSAVDNLTVNAGATVNLMGNDQVVGNLISSDVLPGGGGVVTNSGAMANLFVAQPNNSFTTFAGSINGNINIYKSSIAGANPSNWTLTSAHGYTGSTTIQGGIMILQDSATLASTVFNLNGGQLRFDNRASSLSDIPARISTSSTLNMRSGFLMSLGAPGVNVIENIATINSLEGFNQIRLDTGSNGNRALNIDALNVTAGSQVLFLTGGFGNLGADGNNPNISLDTAPTAIGSVIPWAVVQATSDGNNVHVAMYNNTINPLTGLAYGFAAPNQTGGAFTTPNYQATNFTAATTGQNVNQTTTGTVTEAAVATRTFNSLRFSTNAATTLNLSPAELMRIEAGVIVSAQQTLTLNNGRITSGVSNNTATSLYVNPMNNSVTINSQIVDNGTGALTLVKGGSNTLTLNPSLAAGGSQTGFATNATVAGSTTLTLSGAVATTPAVGSRVYGAGIANGTTVVSVAGSVITLSAPALATTNGGTFGFGDAQVITGTNAAVASGAATMTTITVTNAQAATLFQGATVSGTGMPAGITITTIGAANSGGAGLTTLTVNSGTASAAVAANQAFAYSSAQIATSSGYTGPTIVNAGTLALNGAAGNRTLGGSSLTINTGGIVTMANAGQIAPTTDLTINGGGSLTFAPVTSVSPALGGINALNSVTFNNNGGTAVPTVNIGASGFLTIKNGVVTSNNDNQGSTPLISNGILNFGQIALGTATSATTVQVADIGGFVVGQTVTGLGISVGTTIDSISGNVLTLTGGTATAGLTGSISTVNQAAGSTLAIAPTLHVTTSTINKVTADLQISSVIANSTVGGAGIGGWSNLANGGGALVKTGNGNLSLTGTNTFNNGFNLNEGQVTVGNVAAFGTGTLSIAGGTQLQADGTARTITNAININGDFTFGGQQAGHNITQTTGAINLGGAVRNITVSSPLVTAALGGVISNGGLTKSGDGILALNGANDYAGGTIINAGLVVAGNASALGANTNDLAVKAGATLNMNGLSLTVDGLNGDDAILGGLITNTGAAATLTVGNNDESRATFSGVITNTANAINLTKVGTGTQVLAGVNTYEGTTTVTGGVLLANNTAGSATGSGAINVGAAGTLGGTGNVGLSSPAMTVTVASLGMLRPGDPTVAGGLGTLSVTGNVTLAAAGGSVLDLQISQNNGIIGTYLDMSGNADWTAILGATETAGASDHLNITGTLTPHTSGTTTVMLSAASLGLFAGGMAWDLVDWVTNTNPTATYNFVVDVNLATELANQGMMFDTSRFNDTGYIAIVPEPGRALLLMFGLMALFFRRRRLGLFGF